MTVLNNKFFGSCFTFDKTQGVIIKNSPFEYLDPALRQDFERLGAEVFVEDDGRFVYLTFLNGTESERTAHEVYADFLKPEEQPEILRMRSPVPMLYCW